MALTGRTGLLAAVGALVVWVLGSRTAVAVIDGVLALAVVVDLMMAGSVRGLRLERAGARSVRLGETAELTLTVANPGPRPVRGLVRDAWPPSAGAHQSRQAVHLAANGTATLRVTLTPTRRGDRRPDRVTVRSIGPLGLAGRQGTQRAAWSVRVLPAFPSRRHLPARVDRIRILDGRNAARIRGAGTEFDSLREYVIGDDVRSIDWRASARRSEVTVRSWRPERDRHVLVVLDTGRTSAGRVGDAPRLDAAMDAAMLLAALATTAGDRVDLLCWDRSVRAVVRGVPAARVLGALSEAMAGVEPALLETDMRGLVGEVARLAGPNTLLVLLTSLDEAPVVDGLLPVLGPLRARRRMVVASVADPRVAQLAAGRGDAAAVYAAAAAARTSLRRARAAALLTGRGVEVIDAGPAELAPALADTYLALKAAGRL
jgi:uncharacterized protein (DUF58 family)